MMERIYIFSRSMTDTQLIRCHLKDVQAVNCLRRPALRGLLGNRTAVLIQTGQHPGYFQNELPFLLKDAPCTCALFLGTAISCNGSGNAGDVVIADRLWRPENDLQGRRLRNAAPGPRPEKVTGARNRQTWMGVCGTEHTLCRDGWNPANFRIIAGRLLTCSRSDSGGVHTGGVSAHGWDTESGWAALACLKAGIPFRFVRGLMDPELQQIHNTHQQQRFLALDHAVCVILHWLQMENGLPGSPV